MSGVSQAKGVSGGCGDRAWWSVRGGELGATMALAAPLIVGQLSQMLMGVVDTVMIGRVGVTELAASAFVNNLLFLPLIFGIGLLTSVSIRVSRARGAGDEASARAALRGGLQIAVALGVATLALALAVVPHLGRFGQETAVAEASPRYFLWVAASMIPALLAVALKNHADALQRPWPVLWITLGGVALNVVLNWLLIYGNLGFPRLELEGAGVATLLARAAAVAGLVWWCLGARSVRVWVPRRWFRRPDWGDLRGMVRLGLPPGVQLVAEVGIFVFATLLIGTLGERALAAHQIAISCAGMIFMVPLGLSMALTVRMGAAAGGGGGRERQRAVVKSGWLLAGFYTLGSFVLILLGRHMIAGWFLDDAETVALAAALLLVSAAFQAGDALQITSIGALRGLEDVRFPAAMALLAYWGVALPVGWVLTIPAGFGVFGMWWGITLGLTLAGGVLSRRLWVMSGRSSDF